MARPMARPCVAPMTGYGQRSIAEIDAWKEVRTRCNWSARRAGSRSVDGAGSDETVKVE